MNYDECINGITTNNGDLEPEKEYVVDKFAATAGEKHTLTQILNMLYGGINNEL